MLKFNFKSKKILFLLIILIIPIPLAPYKFAKTLKNTNYDLIEVYHSMDGFSVDKQKNNISITESNIVGNIPSKYLKTFKEGNPKYINFKLYGEFKNINGNKKVFDVKKWYPSDTYVRLYDTFLWRNVLIYIYMLVISIIIFKLILLY